MDRMILKEIHTHMTKCAIPFREIKIIRDHIEKKKTPRLLLQESKAIFFFFWIYSHNHLIQQRFVLCLLYIFQCTNDLNKEIGTYIQATYQWIHQFSFAVFVQSHSIFQIENITNAMRWNRFDRVFCVWKVTIYSQSARWSERWRNCDKCCRWWKCH